MATTLKDLANYLGLSVSCVSRALTGQGRVSSETKKRVYEAARELNYVPNEAARELKMQRSNAIAIIIPDLNNNFYVRLVKCIDHILWEKGYNVLFCDSDGDTERERAYFQLLLTKNLLGTIVAPAKKSDIYDDLPEKTKIVFVDNDPFYEKRKLPFIGIDNIKASYELTKKVLDYGHREIVMIAGSPEESSSFDRTEGFRRCLEDYRVPPANAGVYEGIYYFDGGYKVTKKILKERKLTCLYAHNFLVAQGAYLALKESGLRVPEDVSLVCFDEVESNLDGIEFTRIIQPVEKMGRMAVNMILNEKKDRKEDNRKLLRYELIEGNTLKRFENPKQEYL